MNSSSLHRRWRSDGVRVCRSAGKKLVVYIAAVAGLRHIVRGTAERLAPYHLAAALKTAVIALIDVRPAHESLATTAQSSVPALDNKLYEVEEVKPAKGHLVAAQALSRIPFLYRIFHACGGAVMLVVGAVETKGVVAEVRSPGVSVLL